MKLPKIKESCDLNTNSERFHGSDNQDIEFSKSGHDVNENAILNYVLGTLVKNLCKHVYISIDKS